MDVLRFATEVVLHRELWYRWLTRMICKKSGMTQRAMHLNIRNHLLMCKLSQAHNRRIPDHRISIQPSSSLRMCCESRQGRVM